MALNYRNSVTLKEISEAYQRIRPFVHKTPVLTSSTLDNFASIKGGRKENGVELFFKCENLQKTGAFKARGACNAVLLAKTSTPNLAGIVTHSSGNHGQAVAWACSKVQNKIK
jgi:threonine dehydratase